MTQVLNKGDLIAEGRIKAVQALKGEADKGGNKENQGDSANVPEATTEAKTRPGQHSQPQSSLRNALSSIWLPLPP